MIPCMASMAPVISPGLSPLLPLILSELGLGAVGQGLPVVRAESLAEGAAQESILAAGRHPQQVLPFPHHPWTFSHCLVAFLKLLSSPPVTLLLTLDGDGAAGSSPGESQSQPAWHQEQLLTRRGRPQADGGAVVGGDAAARVARLRAS